MAWLYAHASAVCAAGVLMSAGVAAARYLRRKPWWLRIHRRLGLAAAAAMAAGLFFAHRMVEEAMSGHLAVPHAWLGVAAFVLTLGTPSLGWASLRWRSRGATLRLVHRWLGRLALLTVLLNVISGLRIAGIL